MFQVTNSGSAPLVYTDRHGVKMVVNPGTSEPLDLDEGTGAYVKALQELESDKDYVGPRLGVKISGEADTTPVRPAGSPMPGKKSSVIAAQTRGDQSKMQREAQAGGQKGKTKLPDLPPSTELHEMKRTELDELAEQRGVNVVEVLGREPKNKDDVIEALEEHAEANKG